MKKRLLSIGMVVALGGAFAPVASAQSATDDVERPNASPSSTYELEYASDVEVLSSYGITQEQIDECWERHPDDSRNPNITPRPDDNYLLIDSPLPCPEHPVTSAEFGKALSSVSGGVAAVVGVLAAIIGAGNYLLQQGFQLPR